MEHTVVIKKVITGGKGLAALADGMVVMVPAVLPGETVVVRETRTCKGYKEALLVRVVTASKDRVSPPCPYIEACGGCDLQHAAYPAQLAIKAQILRETLERARLQLPVGLPGPTLASPAAFGYRHRLRLHLDPAGRLGFHQSGSNQVVPIRRCLLATEPINRVIGALVDGGWPERLKDTTAALELIHCPASDRVILVLQPRPDGPGPGESGLLGTLAGLADAVLVQEDRPGRNRGGLETARLSQEFTLGTRNYRLDWDHRCFFQVNPDQNRQLLALALAGTPTPPFAALDLFCGMGNFSIPLGLLGARVTGIEHNRQSIHWAEDNSRRAGLAGMEFIAAKVEQQLKALVAAKARFDWILLDPPRQGLGKAAALLPLLRPERIIVISCDPATLARDLGLMIAARYRLTALRGVDMFPQTHHLESVAVLERN